MMCAPTLMDDVNGEYRGMDDQVHTLAAGEHNYSTFSLWDTFRACHPVYTLFQPERVPSLVNCLDRHGRAEPRRHARLAAAGRRDRHHDRLSLRQRDGRSLREKLPGIDWERAYKVMRKRNMDDDYRGLGSIARTVTFPPISKTSPSPRRSNTTTATGPARTWRRSWARNDDVAIQLKRSQNYQHLFDKQDALHPRQACQRRVGHAL